MPRTSTWTVGFGLALVALAIAAERSDAAWSQRMESDLLALIATKVALPLASIEVGCRETICRLRLGGADLESEAFRTLRSELHHPALGFDQVFVLRDPETVGANVADIFLRRGRGVP